tara:strand:+ start:5235 stop:6671 length:1437 start_codon:yes stop_codon:yes gene_type:complete
MQQISRNYIGGQWRDSTGNRTRQVTEAATGAVIAEVRLASVADAQAAVEAARQAAEGWAATPPQQRADYIAAIGTGIKERAEAIAGDIAREVGMPIKLANRIQLGLPIMAWEAYARHAVAFAWQEEVGNSLVQRVPAGVVVAITPWNYPLHQISAKVAAALAAGCTVVLKPADMAPLSAVALAEIIDAAGLPAGVFNLVVGSGSEIGDTLVCHPEVDVVSFTGSTAIGSHIAALAARSVKKVSLELGGKSAAIILDGADLAQATKATLASCFLNSGQTCTAITRLLVPSKHYATVAALAAEMAASTVVGNPLDAATRMGPLVSAQQRDSVVNYIKTGLAEGAELLAGGPDAPEGLEAGFYVRPTVLGRVDPGSTLGQEEIFGPVLVIIAYEDEDQAVAIANGVPYGLAGAVWADSDERALAVAQRMRAGQIDVNGAPFNLQAPFGGFGQSGVGRENGRYGMEEFVELRSIQMPRRAPA